MPAETTSKWTVTGRAARALEDVSDGLIVLDLDWMVVYANENAARYVSKSKDELIDRNFWAIFPEAYDHEFGILYREAMDTQQERRLEAYYGPLQGWFDVRILPTIDGLTLYFAQVNDRREAQATQRALVGRLEASLAQQQQTQSVVLALAEAMTVEQIASVVHGLATGTLGSSFAGLALLDRRRATIEFVGVDGQPSVDVGVESDLSRCVRSMQALYRGSQVEASSRRGAVAEEVVPGAATAYLPLVVSGRVSGVLVLGWSEDRQLSDQDRTFLQMLAGQAALAIERATLISRQRKVAETLQQAMLPDRLPQVDGVEIDACYLPATIDMSVGGDWYDAFVVPDGRIVFAVGDVSGHGVEAAAVMGQVRNSLRAYMADAASPAAALTKLDGLVSRSAHGLFATVIVGVYDPRDGDLVSANAGHPPLALSSGGRVRYLAGAGGVPIGIGFSNDHTDERITLQVGDAIIGYTDGLIERRGESMEVGMARLAESVATRTHEIGSHRWCADMVDRTLGTVHRADDICVLALRRV